MSDYKCWIEEYGQDEDDGEEFVSYDSEVAAKEMIEWYERKACDYEVASGGEAIISVKDMESGKTEKYHVSGEVVPFYRASKVKD